MFIHGDSLTELKRFEDNSIDSMVTDPPAGIAFMGKAWDTKDQFQIQMRAIFDECLRVLKPGAHGFVWALPRTSHWAATALEEAGFEIRDKVAHVFGSGFPKSYKIGDGWGTALKPAYEEWIMVRKPLEKGLSVARNVEKWGTGAINIDASRIPCEPGDKPDFPEGDYGDTDFRPAQRNGDASPSSRFPSNFIHDGIEVEWSRFFYCAKPSKSEKNAGLDQNSHPTVKPTKLMRYLITMICPPGGKVLDPFAGSASTGVAAIETKRPFIGIEREEEHHEQGEARLAEARGENDEYNRLFE